MSKMFVPIRAQLAVILSCVILGITAENKFKNTDIPCVFDRDCLVEDSDNITAECIDNMCQISALVVPPSLSIVTRIGGKCNVNEECNINHAECSPEIKMCTCINQTVSSFHKRHCLTVALKIGDDCIEDVQCNFPQTTCSFGKCACGVGFGTDSADPTHCRELNGLGASCVNEDECELEHTKCENGTCVCTLGYSAHARECYEKSATYLSSCDMDFQCQKVLGPDATCIRNVCHCQRKHFFSLTKNRCVPQVFRTIANHGAGFHFEMFLLPVVLLSFILA